MSISPYAFSLFPSVPLSTLRGCARGRWYKFNDNVVEEFDMNDETLEYECFGGEYRPKVYDQCKLTLSLSLPPSPSPFQIFLCLVPS